MIWNSHDFENVSKQNFKGTLVKQLNTIVKIVKLKNI